MAEDTRPVQKPNEDIAVRVAEKIKAGENILVALSKNPSVDEMTGAIGLTLALDKIGKHVTAIFSGQMPNALEFLRPENTFESNTNSLRDFIIALNKEKADHLRYKIEGDFVKVFITPYRTVIDEKDLEFSHGDYNVDLVVALNVATAADLDAALFEHGRIMHDAVAINISAGEPGKFGETEWSDAAASSVSEMIASLLEKLKEKDKELLDKEISTALLTGIVAATSRFSNEKTSPSTMVVASRLMQSGADQQLISSNISADLMITAPAATQVNNGAPAPAANPEAGDATKLSVDHGTDPAPSETEQQAQSPVAPTVQEMQGAVNFTPAAAQPGQVATQEETPEQALEKIIQPLSSNAAGGPLMDELTQVAESGDLTDIHNAEPKKDYGALIEQELRKPLESEVVAENPAAQAAPTVAGSPEINGVPSIDYAQGPEASPTVAAPLMTGVGASPKEVIASAEPVASPVMEPVANPVAAAELILPPPPPPPVAATAVLPGAEAPQSPVVTVDPMPQQVAMTEPMASPAPVVAAAPAVEPVMPEVVITEPLASNVPETVTSPTIQSSHTYVGSNPAIAQASESDPGAFRIPT